MTQSIVLPLSLAADAALPLPGGEREDKALTLTLAAVAGVLAPARARWWVIGGAAAALYGLPGDPADVDVLLAPGDARRLLPRLGLAPAPGPAHPRFRSALFARWAEPPLPVEFMAGFALREADGWQAVRLTTRQSFAAAGATLFAPSAAELAALFRRLGRPKDRARADLLDAAKGHPGADPG